MVNVLIFTCLIMINFVAVNSNACKLSKCSNRFSCCIPSAVFVMCRNVCNVELQKFAHVY